MLSNLLQLEKKKKNERPIAIQSKDFKNLWKKKVYRTSKETDRRNKIKIFQQRKTATTTINNTNDKRKRKKIDLLHL
jgi:hypothetical protein